MNARLALQMVIAVLATGLIGMVLFNQSLTIELVLSGFIVTVIYEVIRGKI